MMTMWLPIIFVLFLLAIVIALVVILVRSCTLPRRVAKGACCGQCGYAFTGWSICPECGSAVTDAGVETPRIALRYRGSVGLAACVLVLLSLFFGAVVWGIGLAVFDSWGYGHRTVSATLYQSTRGDLQPNYFAHFVSDMEIGPNDKVRSGEAVLAIELADPTTASPAISGAHSAIARGCSHLLLNLTSSDLAIVYAGSAATTSNDNFDAVVVRSFLVQSGIKIADVDFDEAASAFTRSIQISRGIRGRRELPLDASELFHSPLTVRDQSYHFGPGSPLILPGLSSFATWSLTVGVSFFVLFALALRFIVHRRHRLLSAPATNRPEVLTPPAPAAPAEHS